MAAEGLMWTYFTQSKFNKTRKILTKEKAMYREKFTRDLLEPN